MKLKTIFTAFGFMAIILTFMPFIALDFWWVRMFDFPHLQLTILTSIATILYLIKFDFKEYRDYIFILVLTSCTILQFLKIYPYTVFADFEVLNASKAPKSKISIYTANVFQKNKKSKSLIHQITTLNADLMLFTEVNTRWLNIVSKNLPKDYKYKVEYPLDNTYGMIMYSKLPLLNPEVEFLVSDSIPSIHSKVILKSNDTIQVYAIHPTPPMPRENPMSTDRDTEMMKIAKLSLNSKIPVITFGDFNDVAWSQTSKLFKKVGKFLDIRYGRALYNTFNAKSYIFRWPLDHVFITKEFRHISSKTCEDINSDHFPLYVELSFEPELSQEQEPIPPNENDFIRVKEQMNKFDDN